MHILMYTTRPNTFMDFTLAVSNTCYNVLSTRRETCVRMHLPSLLQQLFRGMSEMSLDESIHGDELLPTAGRDNLEKYRMVLETLKKIDLCRSERGDCGNEQRLLNNMGVHSVVLELIQVPYDKVWRGGASLGV